MPLEQGAAQRALQFDQRMGGGGLAQADGGSRPVQALQVGNRNGQLQVLEAHSTEDAVEQDGRRQIWHGLFRN